VAANGILAGVRPDDVAHPSCKLALQAETKWYIIGFKRSLEIFVSSHSLSRVAARTGLAICAVFLLAHCATERLSARAPAGVDLSGTWKLNSDLSDDPEKVLEQQRQESPSWGGEHGRHRGGGSGIPPFGHPGSGTWTPGDEQDLVGGNNGSDPVMHSRTQSVSEPADMAGGGANDQDDRDRRSRGRGAGLAHLLDAPDRMTIVQSGPKLSIKTVGSDGSEHSEQYTAGEETTINFGRGSAERRSGWREDVFVVSLKAKKGPSREDDYGLDKDGRLILDSQVSKLEIKRVYDRVQSP